MKSIDLKEQYQVVDILIIDDKKNWQEFLFEMCSSVFLYRCDVANDYKSAIDKIHDRNYKVICMNKRLEEWKKESSILLTTLRDNYSEVPVILISGNFGGIPEDIVNRSNILRQRYPNINKIIIKSDDPNNEDFVCNLSKTLRKLLNPTDQLEKVEKMSMKTEHDLEIELKRILTDKIDVFISYASEDYNIAKRLYDDLKREGIAPWLDREDLLPGQNWRATIPGIIRESSYFLLLISKNSVSKTGYIQKEQKIALDLLDECPPDKIFIIPARLDKTEPVYEKLKNLHWADLSDYEKGFQQILKTLKNENLS